MYLAWNEKTIQDFSHENVNNLYNQGYVFTRPAKGLMKQTRSLRIELSKFELSSENKRILKKTENLKLATCNLPLENYTWEIGKLGKDFYTIKFGDGTFSANKIKELLTTEHNFNRLFIYNENLGYCICRETDELLHYSYPFYDLKPNTQNLTPNIGMGMMLKAIIWAKENNKKYIYLGSFQRPGDVYKLQFSGMEWFDGRTWQTNLEELKNVLK